MLPTHHAAATAVAAVPLLRRGKSPLWVGLFAAAAVLIDADHYASYVLRIRDLSLTRAYRFHRRRGSHLYRLHRPAVLVDLHRPLHAPGVLAALVLLSRRFPLLWPVVAGMLFHRLLDYAWSAGGAFSAIRRATRATRQPAPVGTKGAGRAYLGTAYKRTLK
jgi:hypothetical protein